MYKSVLQVIKRLTEEKPNGIIGCPHREDCLNKIMLRNFPHKHVQTYSHKLVHIAEGAKEG